MSRKLRISEYDPLLHKVTNCFKVWAVKSLSFEGRLVLISTVILGLVTLWISAFVLRKGCIRKLESLCARFLWSEIIDNSKMAKMAWFTVCLPKEEGGMGLRNLMAYQDLETFVSHFMRQ